ncbi:alpha/beta hydrolase [Nocardioides caeni]|uniref:Alpha/beta hydrolase n=1 Tax=Nocardioides caeni TaxID=574700 RepID=A0A4S8NM32_9ACTN|nr:alpha/beta hydrolase [Nocardioides caeni]
MPRSLVRALVRRTVKPVLGTRLQPPRQRTIIDALTRVAVLPTGTTREPVALGGVPAERITTPASRHGHALLYLHGGGYTVGSRVTHRAVTAHLADSLGAEAHLLDYRLAPEHPCPAAIDDAAAAYRALLDSGLTPHDIVVAGDSAGGGLALALAIRARDEGLPPPGALGLISPWVDLGLTGLDETVDDPLLTRAWLERCAAQYAGADRRRPEASPLFADLRDLPPLVVQAASDEIIRDDVERLVDAAQAAGVTVSYELLDGHWHVSHLFAGLMREATEAVGSLAAGLRAAT